MDLAAAAAEEVAVEGEEGTISARCRAVFLVSGENLNREFLFWCCNYPEADEEEEGVVQEVDTVVVAEEEEETRITPSPC